MKVIHYAGSSIDGFIAGERDDLSWISEPEWESFCNKVKKIGNIIVARRTYEVMGKGDTFSDIGLNVLTVIVTRDIKCNPEI